MREGLSERQRDILCEVVELYVTQGEPVASGMVARVSPTGLSSASIRHVMGELEAAGLLVQPHTSAGRVPSDLGYRVYIDRLLQHAELPSRDARRLRAMLAPASSLEESLSQVSRVLAEVTREVGMAAAPATDDATLRSIHFVNVAPQRVLGIVVTGGGLVDSRLLVVDRDFSTAELERISNFCTDEFAALTLQQIRARLLALMAEERTRCDELLSGVLTLAERTVATQSTASEVFVDGTARLLERAAPGQIEALRQLFAAFTDKALLLSLLNGFLAASGTQVAVGSELSLPSEGNLGLIVTSFQCPSGERGVVGVIGLKRMEYSRIIPVVQFIGSYLSEFGLGGGGEA
ncbi:MAG TPA: heat-inducible transcriptional repressor HrcA [Thermoanaerobaculaceae bacterium]|nr:heat-inducible transcriptional repressor HrcA [Thermoanaerobaculaceae bacterium]HPS78907.1 heat-inducible transcriptional repressor HrcA [Thermoanaerobaculaceae bacterium]